MSFHHLRRRPLEDPNGQIRIEESDIAYLWTFGRVSRFTNPSCSKIAVP
jgi:hypothetical protein